MTNQPLFPPNSNWSADTFIANVDGGSIYSSVGSSVYLMVNGQPFPDGWLCNGKLIINGSLDPHHRFGMTLEQEAFCQAHHNLIS